MLKSFIATTTTSSNSVGYYILFVVIGWDVDQGDTHQLGISMPFMLVSLTAPKLCSKTFKGEHYLGGRFLPPSLAKKYGLLELPKYKGSDQFVRMTVDSETTCVEKKEKIHDDSGSSL